MLVIKAKEPPKRRFVEEPSDNPLWQLIHRVSDKYYLSFRGLLIETWGKWRDRLNISRLFDALLANNISLSSSVIEAAWASAAEDLAVLSRPLVETITTEAFTDAQSEISTRIGVEFGGPATQQVREWISTRTAEFITRIGETERQAIRDLLYEGINEGRPVASMSRDIRQHLGLSRPQAKVISRLRINMEAQGISPKIIQSVLDKRVAKMIRQRAMVVSRNETILASKQGNRQAYLDAANQGLFDLTVTRRHWVITPLDACKICLPIPGMNPNGAGINEPYQTPIGPLMEVHAHIQCRCVEVIKIP